MVLDSSSPPFPKAGTTAPIYIPRGNSQPIRPGEYFWIKVHNSQAVFRGNLFTAAKQIVVTSKINLNHPVLGDQDIFALQRTREIRNNLAMQLGLSSNLVSLVPATMSNIAVTIEFLLNKENYLGKLVPMINSDSFLAVISVAPGAAAVAKTIGGLAQQVIQNFIPPQENVPILSFNGNFNIGTDASGLCDGYYAILGTLSAKDPLPNPLPKLEVGGDALLADGQSITQLSYITLEVTRVPARTRELNEGAAWDLKLRDAEGKAQEVVDDPFAEDGEKRDVWTKCKALLQEARALLMADFRYVPSEAEMIYKTIYQKIAGLLSGAPGGLAKAVGAGVDTEADRLAANIAPDEDLSLTVAEYEKAAQEAHLILQANQLL